MANFQFISSSSWHDRYLVPLAEGMKKRGHNVRVDINQDFKVEKDYYTITSYHEDLPNLKDSKKIFFLEHAISFVKSSYASDKISLADYVLVQGEIFSQWLKFCHPKITQLKAGFHRIEKLNNQPSTKEAIIKEHNLNPDKPIIIFSPTWHNINAWGGSLSEAYPILKSLNIDNLSIKEVTKIVKEYGGLVIVNPYYKGQSSTEIKNKIKINK